MTHKRSPRGTIISTGRRSGITAFLGILRIFREINLWNSEKSCIFAAGNVKNEQKQKLGNVNFSIFQVVGNVKNIIYETQDLFPISRLEAVFQG